MKLFEAHITYVHEYARYIESNCPAGWKFSAITGDPGLGKAKFCYLTSYDTEPSDLLERMRNVVASLDVPCARMKIERIVFDTKTGRNEIDPWAEDPTLSKVLGNCF